jgi:hypothetical protein
VLDLYVLIFHARRAFMTFHERGKPERFRGFWSLIGMGLAIKVDFCSLYFGGVDLARNLLSV